jgi:hypothetical protein
MRISHPILVIGGMALVGSSSALAQGLAPAPGTAPPPPAAPAAASSATQTPLFDPQQLPATRGEFERLTLTARGDVDGLILKDGTEVKTSPDLAAQIAQALKAGDRLTIHGLRAAAVPLVRAVSITTEATHRTFVETAGMGPTDAPPPHAVRPPPGTPPARGPSSEIAGRVRMTLHGPQGEINGVLLENGTMLRFPPDQKGLLASAVQPRQPVVAEGVSLTNAFGTVVDVEQMGPSRDRMVAVGPPAPPPGALAPPAPPVAPAPPAAG